MLAFGFGSGLAPVAPGTVGTLVAVPLYLLLAPLPLQAYLLAVAVLFLVGVPVCGAAARSLGVHDDRRIVFDEIVGLLVTMTMAPRGWAWLLAGFLLFRIFDVLKPWPIARVDRGVGGGFGIMLDDVLAGVYAAIVLQLGALVPGIG